MPYDINTSLERLEQSLKDIESAKKQVEKTVKTSNELQDVVAGYAYSGINVPPVAVSNVPVAAE